MKVKRSFLKWTGSKRYLVPQIENLMPSKIETYYEPFLGSGIVLTAASQKAVRLVGSDVSSTLMDLWNLVKHDPYKIINHYETLWKQEASKIYYDIRTRFNKTRDPLDFYFLTRTCINGLIRFNQKGEFNSSYHYAGREGMIPKSVQNVILEWHKFLCKYDVMLQHNSYEHIFDKVKKNDFVFLDPPYNNSANRMYEKYISSNDIMEILEKLNSIDCKWLLTYDGFTNGTDLTFDFDKSLYKTHGYFAVAKSAWQKRHAVQESYYTNY